MTTRSKRYRLISAVLAVALLFGTIVVSGEPAAADGRTYCYSGRMETLGIHFNWYSIRQDHILNTFLKRRYGTYSTIAQWWSYEVWPGRNDWSIKNPSSPVEIGRCV